MKISAYKGELVLEPESAAEVCQLEYVAKKLTEINVDYREDRHWNIERLTIFCQDKTNNSAG
jgi:hypothetical protein